MFKHGLSSLPIRQGGLGITSQVELAPLAFISSVEQALPFFGGEKGVCPSLGHLAEFPPVLQLCFGAFSECSQDVHNLVVVLAVCRVRTLGLQGAHPQPAGGAPQLQADGAGGWQD